jgi:hypothetical protein
MSSPRRFLDGVTNVGSEDPMGSFPFLDPTKYSIFYQDFLSPHFGAALNNAAATYDGVVYTADADTIIDCVAHANANGCLSILTTASDDDLGYGYQVADSMIMRSGKKFFMETKLMATVAGTIAQSELFVGIANSVQTAADVTTFIAADGLSLTSDDHIGWFSPDGDAKVYFAVHENDVGSLTPVGTMVTATWITLSVYYDGTDCYLFTDDLASGAITPTIPVTACGVHYWFRNGEAQIKTLLIDYLFIAAER